MPLVSVLMPVLNGERYLPTALRSLLVTLPRDAEVLVMDDGSTDSSSAILQRASEADRRVRVVRHEAPAGVSTSLNELAGLADCEFLARMDADDVVLPHRWHLTQRALQSADFAFTSVLYIDGEGQFRGADQPGRFSAEAVPFHLLFGCCLVHPTVTMRRAAFEALGGYADTRAEDYELWLRAAAAGYRLVRVARPGLRYRRHEGQVTVRSPWSGEDANSPLYRAYAQLLEERTGRCPADWPTLFAAALSPSEIDEALSERIQCLHRDILSAASSLSPVDLGLLRWRAIREASRTRSRAKSAVRTSVVPGPDVTPPDTTPSHTHPQFAYVILCHTDAEAVLRLVRRIRELSPTAAVLVCHDVPFVSPDQVRAAGGIDVLSRFTGRWGDWSIVDKQLEGLKAAQDLTRADYITIVSGQDYPVRDLASWEAAVAETPAYAMLSPMPSVPRDFDYEWHVRDQPIWAPKALSHAVRLATSAWRRARPNGLDAYVVSRPGGPSWWLGRPKKTAAPIPPVKASGWFLLSREAAADVLRRHEAEPELSAFFRTVRVPDEYYIASVVRDSGRLCLDLPISSARFVDGAASPVWLTVEELTAARDTGAPFARKIPPRASAELIEFADRMAVQEP